MRVDTEMAMLRASAQHLLGPPPPDAAAAVRHLLAVQAQDLPQALTCVALRLRAADTTAVTAALDTGHIVRSWPMRGTLHLVAAEDLAWLQTLTTPRLIAQAAKRRAALGLDDAALHQARHTALAALADRGRLSREALYQVWREAGLPTDGQRGYHMLWHTAQTGAVCFGPTAGSAQLIVAAADWIPAAAPQPRPQALAQLALRYFRGHGPATVADLARWAGLPIGELRPAVAQVRDELDTWTAGGVVHYLDPAVPQRLADHRGDSRRVWLLPGFDEFILGYADRSCCLPAAYAHRIVPGGNGVFRPTVVADGAVVGVWRHEGRGARRRLTAEPFTSFPPWVQRGMQQAYTALPAP
ncbi:MAG TPA: winged helix DNA-binding domain-containing protein [Pilimelia sp.]|nr:winged helix DNA-binding domain-containing protein [Pilimelia sp.]